MNARECFGVVVRSVGLVVLLFGLYQVVTLLWMVTSVGFGVLPIWLPLLSAAVACAVGYYLIQGGALFVRIAYPGSGRE